MPELRATFENARLYLVTPANPPADDLDEFLPRVLEAGVKVVQLREKDMEGGDLLAYCEVVRRRTDQFGAIFIVNDRVDLAIASGADGVHLGQNDLPVDRARAQIGPDALIGLSTHSPAQIDSSSDSGADYIGAGPVYPTPTKPGRPAAGLEVVSYAHDHSRLPFFAIGGIDSLSLPAVLAAGAKRICVLRAVTEASDPAQAVKDLTRALGENEDRMTL